MPDTEDGNVDPAVQEALCCSQIKSADIAQKKKKKKLLLRLYLTAHTTCFWYKVHDLATHVFLLHACV